MEVKERSLKTIDRRITLLIVELIQVVKARGEGQKLGRAPTGEEKVRL